MARNRLAGLVCLLSVWTAGLPAAAEAQLGPADPYVLSVCPPIARLLEDGIQDLVNPVFENPAEVEIRAENTRAMLACLNSLPVTGVSRDWARNLRYHLRLFQAFVAPTEPNAFSSSLELVDLQSSQDPALRRLVEDLGLDAPEGLVLIRYFESPGQMPEIIRRAFESPQTRAVTMSSRYIAVLTRALGEGLSGRSDPALAATLSHELVHAFLNARLDFDALPMGFPRWFHEGMAVHFGDRGRVHIAVDPVSGSFLRTEPTARYEQYGRVFYYLESQLGPQAFRQSVRQAVENVDPSLLYRSLGFNTYEELVENAELWWRWWPVPPVWLQGLNAWAFAFVGVLLAAGAFIAWRRWQPAVQGSAMEVGVNRDLIESIKCAEVRNVRYLLRSGASPEAVDESGWSALAWAVWVDNAEVVELLLDCGAVPSTMVRNIADSRMCSEETVRMLADAVTRADDDSRVME